MCFILLNTPLTYSAPVVQNEKDWYHLYDLVNRLYQEKWKFEVVRKELSKINSAANDLVYVSEQSQLIGITGKSEADNIEKRVKAIDKKVKKTFELLEDIEIPIEGAILIVMEMLKDETNKDMVDILINDNIKRIQKLIKVKKYTDNLWNNLFQSLELLEQRIGLVKEMEEKGIIEDEFIKTLVSQIGLHSENFYKSLNVYKNLMIEKSSKDHIARIYKLDFTQVLQKIFGNEYGIAKIELENMILRYTGKAEIQKLYFHLGNVYYELEDYGKSIENYGKINKMEDEYPEGLLGKMKGFFAQEKDSLLVEEYKELINTPDVKDHIMHSSKYLVIQSLYELNLDSDIENVVLSFNRKSIEYFKSIYIYGKSLVRQNKEKEANEIFKSIISQNQLPENLRNKVSLSLAHLKVDQGYYDNALNDFKKIMDFEAFQPNALFGMVWCYIRLGETELAEFTLKSLINQYPDTEMALEGLILMSKWKNKRAAELWEYKKNSLTAWYEIQIFKKLKKNARRLGLAGSEKNILQKKIDKNKSTLKNREIIKLDEILKLLEESIQLADYIKKHYRSGEFLEVEFVGQRERALEMLNQILTNQKKRIALDKTIITKAIFSSQLLKLEVSVNYKEWLKEINLLYEKYKFELIDGDNDKIEQTELKEYFSVQNSLKEKGGDYLIHIINLVDELMTYKNSKTVMDELLFIKGYVLYEKEKTKRKNGLNNRVKFNDSRFESSWNRILEDFSESKYAVMTQYMFGKGLLEQNDEKGYYLLRRFIFDNPDHKYREHANYLLGNYYFNLKRYRAASREYFTIMKNPSSGYFMNALYRQSWTYYKKNFFVKALKGFTYILGNELSKTIDKQNQNLQDELLEVISRCFAGLKVPKHIMAKKIKKMFGFSRMEPILAKVLHRVAVAFRRQGDLQKSMILLKSVRDDFPDYENIPEIYLDLAIVNDMEGEFKTAMEMRKDLYNRFKQGTDWYNNLSSDKKRTRVDSICESSLDGIAQYYFSEAKLKNSKSRNKAIVNEEDFLEAIFAFETIIENFPESKNIYKWRYSLGEAYFAIGDYYNASKSYLIASNKANGKIVIPAAYNAIIASKKLLEKARRGRNEE